MSWLHRQCLLSISWHWLCHYWRSFIPCDCSPGVEQSSHHCRCSTFGKHVQKTTENISVG